MNHSQWAARILVGIFFLCRVAGVEAQYRDVLVDASLKEGFDLGLNTSEGRTDWLVLHPGFMRMFYPGGAWGTLFITVGEPRGFPRPYLDLSAYRMLSIDMRGLVGGESVEIGLKTNIAPDDGREAKSRVTLSTEWKTYHFPVELFAGTDMARLYVVTEFVFSGQVPTTVDFRNIRFAEADGTSRSFSLADRGAMSAVSPSLSDTTQVGYGRIQPNSGQTSPAGVAIFSLSQAGVIVSETAVPSSPLIQNGRLFVEVEGSVDTGIAIANPNSQAAVISFFFTNEAGATFGSGTTTIAANSQIARFLSEPPFNAGATANGTFTFSSSRPVSVITLRGLSNERGQFLMTTLPVAAISSATTATVVLPHFADGGGWTTQVALVNPTDQPQAGTLQFFSQGSDSVAGVPLTLNINGQVASSFPYAIPARSSRRFRTSNPATVQVGSVRTVPSANNSTPTAFVVFSFRPSPLNVTVAEAGVSSLQAGSQFRIYAENSQTEKIRTGIAIANASESPATVTLEYNPSGGTPLTTTLMIPASGQAARFLDEMLPLSGAPDSGVLRVVSSSSIVVVGLRGRTNQQGDFLVTTMPATNEALAAPTGDTVFPHIVDSGGYTSQLILFSGQAGQSTGGTVRFYSQDGLRWNLQVR